MTRLLVLAEGESEELFVKRMLAPHLAEYGVHASAVLVRGNRWPAIWRTLRPLLFQRDAWVTTLLDYYGLGNDFPGMEVSGACRPDIESLEQSLADTADSLRFIPFLTKHEFEAWYFAAPERAAEHFDRADLAAILAAMVRECGGPEEINQGPDTHPSKRLAGLRIGFRKTREISLLEKIGIPAIRSACPHFAHWLDRLESLPPTP